jgi:hypothetical protein
MAFEAIAFASFANPAFVRTNPTGSRRQVRTACRRVRWRRSHRAALGRRIAP